MRKRLINFILLGVILVAAPACVTTQPKADPVFDPPAISEVDYLMARDDFVDAVRAAPEWVRAALQTIAKLVADNSYQSADDMILRNIVMASEGWGKREEMFFLDKHMAQLVDLYTEGVIIPAWWSHNHENDGSDLHETIGFWVNVRLQEVDGETCLMGDFVPFTDFLDDPRYDTLKHYYGTGNKGAAVSIWIYYRGDLNPEYDFDIIEFWSCDFVGGGNLTDTLFKPYVSPKEAP